MGLLTTIFIGIGWALVRLGNRIKRRLYKEFRVE
jgi:hypothetical protein